jgi:hypothetical protein
MIAVSGLATLPAIGLAELEERAALMSRVDRKYIVPVSDVQWLLDRLAPVSRVLDIGGVREFRYESLYFDTEQLLGYRRAAYRHRRRFKVRTRTYVDSGSCFLEMKMPGPRGSTVKYREVHDPGGSRELGPGGAFVDEVFLRHDLGARLSEELFPVLRTEYRRCTLLLTDAGSRVTIDTALRWATGDRELHLPRIAIVETKTRRAAGDADRRLWQRGHRPVAVSKYATGLAALRAELPAAPWRRVIRRHFCPREGVDE